MDILIGWYNTNMSIEYCRYCGKHTFGDEFDDVCNECDDILSDDQISTASCAPKDPNDPDDF